MGNKSSGGFSPADGKKQSVKKGKAEEGEGGQPASDKTNGTAATGDAPQSESANETTPEAQIEASTGQPSGTTTAQKPAEEEEGEAPVVKEYQGEISVLEGQQAILRVEVSGVPHPTITWRLGEKTVEPDYAIEIAKDGALCFVSVEMTHAGIYCFTARNASGSEEGKIELKVRGEGEEGWAAASAAREERTETKPVPVEEFGEHVAQLHANNNAGFYREYQDLPSGEEGHTVNVFKMPGNLPKNRFRNIAVYDDNRIALEALPSEVTGEDEDSDYINAHVGDYINASYIDGYSKPKQYIACQGPLSNTVVDFWRAVWQEEVGSIVMVTNLTEGNNVKCHQYWPSSGSAHYGPFTVSLAEQLIFADYVIRHLHISLGGKSRKVLHLQFTSWPDHGVPEYAGPSLTYLRRVKAETKGAKGPAIFHCSAGVGRTGTLLSVDIALEQAGTEGVVDIQGIVSRLREQRMMMVQTHDQYGFIHDAVLESLICGETQIPAQNLPKVMGQLASTDSKHGKTGYEVQFGVLEQVSPKPHEVLTLTAQSFPDKNRSMEFLPSELWKVPLLMEHPGYINATFANGYKQHRGYIIAQAPMEGTCRDFWKMVYDRRCGVVIMLSQLMEQDKEVCYGYWPSKEEGSGEEVTHGEFTITAGNVKYDNIVQRNFTLVYNKMPHQQQKVTQYQVSSWSEEGLAQDNRALLELIEKVAATQRRTGNNPIVVHGVNTVSRCGLLVALSNAIDCCKTEGTVDVFQAVKALRIQKSGSVVTVQQYQSIFSIMQQFLNSFDIYSNFK
ncbi:Receptor-type tyrosine-protein phosphatase epsilon [Geodia barretti]|uniref:protein-tyrosine-phosphatase n=2 Tax=Geodia barretti TaxID=519541 RepID=A0AA35RXY6_GEOBA|nr:Receptor-type tyrosine-protein phosphatase epsilon [Geodia barretti]